MLAAPPITDTFPLLPNQLEILATPGFSRYIVIHVYEIVRPPEPEHLDLASRKLVASLPGLRIGLLKTAVGYRQYFRAPGEEGFSGVIEDTVTETEPEAIRNALGKMLGRHSLFDLEQDCLFRLVRVKVTATGEQYLILIAHHIISDYYNLLLIDRSFKALLAAEMGVEVSTKVNLEQNLEAFAWYLDQKVAGREQPDFPEADLNWWLEFSKGSFPEFPFPGKEVGVPLGSTFDFRPEEVLLLRKQLKAGISLSDALFWVSHAVAARYWGTGRLTGEILKAGRSVQGFGKMLRYTCAYLARSFPFPIESAPSSDPIAQIVDLQRQLEAVPNEGLAWSVLRWKDQGAYREALSRIRPHYGFNFVGKYRLAFDPDLEVLGLKHYPNADVRWNYFPEEPIGIPPLPFRFFFFVLDGRLVGQAFSFSSVLDQAALDDLWQEGKQMLVDLM